MKRPNNSRNLDMAIRRIRPPHERPTLYRHIGDVHRRQNQIRRIKPQKAERILRICCKPLASSDIRVRELYRWMAPVFRGMADHDRPKSSRIEVRI